MFKRNDLLKGGAYKSYGEFVTTVATAGLDIDQTMTAINAAPIPNLTVSWVPGDAPGFDDPADEGHDASLRFVNSTSGSARVRYTMGQTGSTTGGIDANMQLFSTSAHPIWAVENNVAYTDSLQCQAHDNLTLEVSYEGNRSGNGDRIGGSVSVSNLWEGDDIQNAAKLNAALTFSLPVGTIIRYDRFNIVDNNSTTTAYSRFSDLKVGDSWMIYTKADTNGLTADNVTLSLYDGETAASDAEGRGITTGIVYAFQDGAVDNKPIEFGEMMRTKRGKAASNVCATTSDLGT
ncbi:MAG: hypothetical protein LBO21_04435 [Synergistaceae bacterium]|nr:hypothetical protein [Synergistaceae bacterium]